MMRFKAPVVKLNPNRLKTIEAIVLLVSEIDRVNGSLTQYDIVKSIFLADRRHLNEFGRPVTFDNYVAMKHGPVPSLAYDLLKEVDTLGLWTRVDAAGAKKLFSGASRKFDEDVLSPSDAEALSNALVTVRSLGFAQIRKLTHEDPAYVDAWTPEDEDKKAFDMSLSLLFDTPNQDKALDVAHASHHT